MTGGVAFVASSGGHVDEAFEIAGQFAQRSGRFWIASQTPQTKALLEGERVEWVPDVRSRQGFEAARALPEAIRIMRRNRPIGLVSTGSALTVPYMLAARVTGVPVTYVESATRLVGPSVTGRMAELIPGIQLFCQGEGWNRHRWSYFGSIFDRYEATMAPAPPISTALVTVGSEKFPFTRMLDTACDALRGVETHWQTGNTPVRDLRLPGDVRPWWPGDELARAAREADVVLTHAGVGSILMVLRAGGCPVVLPRVRALNEHVDDHQTQLSETLARRNLVVVAGPGDDLAVCIRQAVSRRIVISDG